eukprot:scaffold7809_cov22-Cyclotella_meneghiniana.AAC.1
MFEAAPCLSPALVCSWIDFARPRWQRVDMESDDWAREFFLACLKPELKREVLHETQDFSPAHHCALSIAWIAMRNVFSGTFEHFSTLEQVIIKFDIRNYPAQNVVKASEYISAASKALRTISRIPGQSLHSILEGMRQSDCSDFNLRCSALMVRPDMSSYSVYGASSDDLFRRIRSLLTETSSWYTGYLQVGKWPAAQSSLAPPSSSSTFSTTSVDPRFIQQVVALANQLSPRRRPSRANPCKICGSPDHWKADCPNNRVRPDSRGRSDSRGRPDSRSRADSRGRTPDRRWDFSRSRDHSNDSAGRRSDRAPADDKSVSFSSVNNITRAARSYS